VAERIVTDIDAVGRVVRFPGWQNTTQAAKEKFKNLYIKPY
jgi:type I restriction enzyme R subunit